MREDVGDLEINISHFTVFRQTTEYSGKSTGESVCSSENGMYFWFLVTSRGKSVQCAV